MIDRQTLSCVDRYPDRHQGAFSPLVPAVRIRFAPGRSARCRRFWIKPVRIGKTFRFVPPAGRGARAAPSLSGSKLSLTFFPWILALTWQAPVGAANQTGCDGLSGLRVFDSNGRLLCRPPPGGTRLRHGFTLKGLSQRARKFEIGECLFTQRVKLHCQKQFYN